jgi:hypothetical protein
MSSLQVKERGGRGHRCAAGDRESNRRWRSEDPVGFLRTAIRRTRPSVFLSDKTRAHDREETDMAQQGYGSRWKRWLLVYVGVAIVAYAVIYFAFFHQGGSGGGGLYLLGALPGAEALAGRTSRRRPIRERSRHRQ